MDYNIRNLKSHQSTQFQHKPSTMSQEKKDIEVRVSARSLVIAEEVSKADGVLGFLEEHEDEFAEESFSPQEENIATKKIHWVILTLTITVNTLLFMDKATLSYASILEIYDSCNLTDALYDDLNSIFYAGYVVGQSLNFVLQKYDIRKFITVILAIWTVIIFCHAAASNFAGLAVLRFLLGFFESIVVPLFEVTLYQFYTPNQRATIQPILWIGCVGFPVVTAGFIAYGVL